MPHRFKLIVVRTLNYSMKNTFAKRWRNSTDKIPLDTGVWDPRYYAFGAIANNNDIDGDDDIYNSNYSSMDAYSTLSSFWFERMDHDGTPDEDNSDTLENCWSDLISEKRSMDRKDDEEENGCICSANMQEAKKHGCQQIISLKIKEALKDGGSKEPEHTLSNNDATKKQKVIYNEGERCSRSGENHENVDEKDHKSDIESDDNSELSESNLNDVLTLLHWMHKTDYDRHTSNRGKSLKHGKSERSLVKTRFTYGEGKDMEQSIMSTVSTESTFEILNSDRKKMDSLVKFLVQKRTS
ncbi:hypothetical protein RFI_23176 [Reticulomyxa filosa]|uniref:Uncharacterized protein n=1 Tax=Reticulomyxa filosa TaxID=46433 RepID=X6MJZ3_RETFI|nr:hypothetical protein RFI_23176 [Reticulomyxa filosa]|eukprot:ETO14189.1 hypothetical protein RFI_23176 [Reticulomyxa filosa]